MTAPVVCPYCGRESIEPGARFCDRCGIDLSNFWKTVGPLLRQLYVQQISLDEQTESAETLKEHLKALEATLSAAVPEPKHDAVATAKPPESIAALGGAPPETDPQVPEEPRGDRREHASKSTGSFFRIYFAARQKRGEETARPRMENKCQACGYNNRGEAIFCRSCGTVLAKGTPLERR